MPDGSNCLAARRGRLVLSDASRTRVSSRVATFTDGKLDTAFADPDLRWDDATSSGTSTFRSPHGTMFDPPGPQMIRHATSPDLENWTIDDTPAFVAPTDSAAWDTCTTETPSVVYNPGAPADRRYLLFTAALASFPGYTFPDYAIGAAFSADGKRSRASPPPIRRRAKPGSCSPARTRTPARAA